MKKVMNVIKGMKEAKQMKLDASRIAIIKQNEFKEFVCPDTEVKYRVYKLRCTVGDEDVTRFMPGFEMADFVNVNKHIEEARVFWKKHASNIKYEEIK